MKDVVREVNLLFVFASDVSWLLSNMDKSVSAPPAWQPVPGISAPPAWEPVPGIIVCSLLCHKGPWLLELLEQWNITLSSASFCCHMNPIKAAAITMETRLGRSSTSLVKSMLLPTESSRKSLVFNWKMCISGSRRLLLFSSYHATREIQKNKIKLFHFLLPSKIILSLRMTKISQKT